MGRGSVMGARLLLLWLQNVLLIGVVNGYESVFFDKYAHCNRHEAFDLSVEVYTLYPLGGGLAHENMMCRIIFKAPPGLGICLTFNKFYIQDCGVEMHIESSDTNPDPDESWRTLTCKDQRPNQMCTSSRYVALKLTKKQLNGNLGYSFKINVESSSQTGEEGVLFASIGVFALIIFGVVLFIIFIAVIVIYCCCRRIKQQEKQSAVTQARLVEPTAPPLGDVDADIEAAHPLQNQISYETAAHPQYPPPPYTPYEGQEEAPCEEKPAAEAL